MVQISELREKLNRTDLILDSLNFDVDLQSSLEKQSNFFNKSTKIRNSLLHNSEMSKKFKSQIKKNRFTRTSINEI